MKNRIQKILYRIKPEEGLDYCYVSPNIPEKKLRNASASHGLNYNDTILFLYDSTFFGSASEGCVITEKGVSIVIDDNKPADLLKWQEIQRVSFKLNKFYFFRDSGTENYSEWKRENIASSFDKDNNHCEKLAKAFSEIANLFENQEEKEFEKILELSKPETIEDLEFATKEYFQQYGEKGKFSLSIHSLKAMTYFDNGNLSKAKEEINFCFHDINTKNYTPTEVVYILHGDILLEEENEYDALTSYKIALDLCEDKTITAQINEKIDKANDCLKDRFLEKKYGDRKLILIDNSQADLTSQNFKVLLDSKLPEIKFEMGHPVNKELYVGHPYNKQVYIPINSLEESLFMDKFQEFSYFLQSLGATKISIINKRGKEAQKYTKINSETNLEGDAKVLSTETNKAAESRNDGNFNQFKHISREQNFSPIKKPFLPKNLVWYHHETSWQRLYDQRINGNILNHTEVISTEQNQVITKNEKRSIQQSLQYYLIEANASRSVDTDQIFKEKETTEWTIHIEFAPIETLIEKSTIIPDPNIYKYSSNSHASDQNKSIGIDPNILERDKQLSPNETKYLTRIELLVEDEGLITEEDRRILDRVKNKLNLSDERAEKLEQQVLNSFHPSYSDNELSYIDEIKFCLEDDGIISEKERQVLELEREELGISNERAIELEEEILQKLKLV